MTDEVVRSIIEEAISIAEQEFEEEFPMPNPDKEYLIRKDAVATGNDIVYLCRYDNSLTNAIIHLMIKMEQFHLYRMNGEEYSSIKEWAFSKLGEYQADRTIHRWVAAAMGAIRAMDAGITDDPQKLFDDVGIYKASMINQSFNNVPESEQEDVVNNIINSKNIYDAQDIVNKASQPFAPRITIIVRPETPDGVTHIEAEVSETQLAILQLKLGSFVDFEFGD